MRHLLLLFKRNIEGLEYDPVTQYRFHFVSAWLWFAGLIIVPIFDRPHVGAAWVALAILEASLWANFATHLSGMSAALAAKSSAEDPSRRAIMDKLDQLDQPEVPTGTPTPEDLAADFDSGLLE